jgi:uncharacterized repeat protein (TIGR01451 family)
MPTRRTRFAWLSFTVLALLASALPQATASADPNPPVSSFTWSPNMEPLGWEPRPNPNSSTINSDLAFWGNRAYQGTYDGFQIIDITNPEDPRQVLDYSQCNGNQGDVVVWGNILVRSWNSGASATATCDGEQIIPPLPDTTFEGLHVFDISNESNPDLVASVNLACGSHTATGVPDLANNRLLIYNSASSGTCPQIEIVEVPLANPAGASMLRAEPAGRSCHDTGVILGDAMLAACAGGNGFTVWTLDPAEGGSLLDPLQLYTKTVTGVSIAHSHTFSWDGKVLVFGHEPGGGVSPQCQATSPTVNKTLFFYEAETGTELGRWVLPRPQTAQENCTIHNFNVVPSGRRNILVSGNYQSGIAVVDFTDPANPVEIAYADPAPLVPEFDGGDWSSYWYDGIIYESDITRGMLTWRLNDPAVIGAATLGHLNPQTQESTIPFVGDAPEADLSITKSDSKDPAATGRNLTYTLTVRHNGPPDARATGVLVTDDLPEIVDFVSATPSQGTCREAEGTVTCNLGTMASGQIATIDIVVRPTSTGLATNTASVDASPADPNPANNTDTENTSICRITSKRASIQCT